MNLVRKFLAEILISWAFSIMPDSPEKSLLAKQILEYSKLVIREYENDRH